LCAYNDNMHCRVTLDSADLFRPRSLSAAGAP
jgi:hypothetical protein